MNKNLKYLVITLSILAIIYFVFVNKPFSNFRSERKDFAIKDTASITRIFLADKKNNTVLIEKNADGDWYINNTFKGDLQKINLLKATIHDVEVRNPINESEFNSTIASLSTLGIKTEFYAGEKLLKTIYIGSPTPDNTGTFMMLENASAPFVTHIPGFVGYLTPRFSVIPERWKSKEIFVLQPEAISSIEVNYPVKPNAGFYIDCDGITPKVYMNKGGKEIPSDLNFIRYYIASFNNLYAESYLDDMPKQLVDSIKSMTPYCKFIVKLRNNQMLSLDVYMKASDRRTKAQFDETTMLSNDIDPEKYYAFMNGEPTIMLIQQYAFGKLFKHSGDFVDRNMIE
jgi:hypothetical protein